MLAVHRDAEPVLLDGREVPHQPEQRHVRRWHRAPRELLGVEAGALHLRASAGSCPGSAAAATARRSGRPRSVGRPRGEANMSDQPNSRVGSSCSTSLMGRHSPRNSRPGQPGLWLMTGNHRRRSSMQTLYTAEALATGAGREGHVRTTDGRVDLDLAVPKDMGGSGEGANPEQLFASGLRRLLPLRAAGRRAQGQGRPRRLDGRRARRHRAQRRGRVPARGDPRGRRTEPARTTRPSRSSSRRTRSAPTPTRPAATSRSRSPSPTTESSHLAQVELPGRLDDLVQHRDDLAPRLGA